MQLGRPGQERQGALAAARPQVPGRAVGVVPGLDGDVLELLEGVATRLARLELDDVEDLPRVGDEQVVKAQQQRRAFVYWALGPGRLGRGRGRDGGGHVGRRAGRHLAKELARKRRLDRDRLAGPGHRGARRQAREHC